jgi:hypothetical protein
MNWMKSGKKMLLAVRVRTMKRKWWCLNTKNHKWPAPAPAASLLTTTGPLCAVGVTGAKITQDAHSRCVSHTVWIAAINALSVLTFLHAPPNTRC